MPALAITASMGPNAFSAVSKPATTEGFVLDIHGDGGRVLADLTHQRVEPVGAARGSDDFRAGFAAAIRAKWLPRPDDAPVIRTVRPDKSDDIVSISKGLMAC